MHTPLISIIIPIYKVEPYLRRCLDSIVNQTYTNLEIILVDDGSPNGYPQICDEHAANDNRLAQRISGMGLQIRQHPRVRSREVIKAS